MNAILKPAQIPDVERLLPFVHEYRAADGLEFDSARDGRTVSDLLADPRLGRIWFIRKGDEDCGYIALCYGFSLELGGRDGFVDELYIRPAFRGRGLGTRALEAACSAAREDGVRSLYLEVRRDNQAAQRYYARLGFERRDRYYLMTRLV